MPIRDSDPIPLYTRLGWIIYLFPAHRRDPHPDHDRWKTPPLLTWYIDDPGGKRIAVSGHWPPEKR